MFLIRNTVKKIAENNKQLYLLIWKRLEPCHHNVLANLAPPEDKDWQERKIMCQRNISSCTEALMVHHGECFTSDLCNHRLHFIYGMSVFPFLVWQQCFSTVVYQFYCCCMPCIQTCTCHLCSSRTYMLKVQISVL